MSEFNFKIPKPPHKLNLQDGKKTGGEREKQIEESFKKYREVVHGDVQSQRCPGSRLEFSTSQSLRRIMVNNPSTLAGPQSTNVIRERSLMFDGPCSSSVMAGSTSVSDGPCSSSVMAGSTSVSDGPYSSSMMQRSTLMPYSHSTSAIQRTGVMPDGPHESSIMQRSTFVPDSSHSSTIMQRSTFLSDRQAFNRNGEQSNNMKFHNVRSMPHMSSMSSVTSNKSFMYSSSMSLVINGQTDRKFEDAVNNLANNFTYDNMIRVMENLKEDMKFYHRELELAGSVQDRSEVESMCSAYSRTIPRPGIQLNGAQRLEGSCVDDAASVASSSYSVMRRAINQTVANKFITTIETKQVQKPEVDEMDASSDDSCNFRIERPAKNVKRAPIKPTLKVKNAPRRLVRSKTKHQFIKLRDWLPVACEEGLIFTGVDEDKENKTQTAAVKKRLDPRKVELVDGSICSLIGAHVSITGFPKVLTSKLKNGLHAQWRIFLSDLQNFQSQTVKKRNSTGKKKVEVVQAPESDKRAIPIQENTPITRRHAAATREEKRLERPSEKVQPSSSNNANSDKDTPRIQSKALASSEIGRRKNAERLEKKTRTNKQKNQNDTRSCDGIRHEKTSATLKRTMHMDRMTEMAVSPEKKTNRELHKPQTTSGRKQFNNNKQLASEKPKRKQNRKVAKELVEERQEDSSLQVSKTASQHEFTRPLAKVPPRKIALESAEISMNGGCNVDQPPANITLADSTLEIPKNNSKGNRNKRKQQTDANTATAAKKKASPLKNTNKPKSLRLVGDSDSLLDDIILPEVVRGESKAALSRSKLRRLTAETPPLQYFTSNLRVLNNVTPRQSPAWPISQRSQSEAKEFQRRRNQTYKRKIAPQKGGDTKVKTAKATKGGKTKDKEVDAAMKWLASKQAKSPRGYPKLYAYMMGKSHPDKEDSDHSEEEEDSEEGEEEEEE